MGGLLASLWLTMDIRGSQGSASDFKTLYASAWCFTHSVNAYDTGDIQNLFLANHVITPLHWFGHMPVYPPFTLAVLAPLTFVSMVAASYVWMAVSAALMACAIFLLCRTARNLFNLSLPWRLMIVAACGAAPALGFGFEVVNVSVAVGALCIITILAPPYFPRWVPAIALAIALLLKPHIAVWVWLCLLLSDRWRSRGGAATALRAAGIGAAFLAGVMLWLASHHMLLSQMQSYHSMVWSETHDGSMSPNSLESLSPPSQITSLISMLGYWVTNAKMLTLLSTLCLGLIALVLMRATIKMRRTHAGPQDRLLLIACWCGLGLMATYHRAHDATVLLLLVPWVVARLRNSLRDWSAWVVVALYTTMAWGPTEEQMRALGAHQHLHALANAIFYRQSSIATVGLELLLLYLLYSTIKSGAIEADAIAAADRAEVPQLSQV
jgi:hypothetical protein